MGISRKISLILSILAVCLPMHAHASDLANDSFIRQVLDRQHFEPDGKYHLFGSRGELAERSGHIGLGNIQSHQLGNLMIQQAAIKGNIGYIVRFSDHGHEVHSPFDNHASHSDSDEAGSPVDGFSLYRIHWDGYEHHPADGYDGPQGGGYPVPKGARDIYSYDIKGVAQNIRLNLTDNRSTGQRLADRFHNAGAMLTQGVGDGFKRATRYSPELDRSGNAAEAFNGTADIVKNIIGAAGEIVGAGDAVQGISEGSNIAVMHGLGLLSTENKMARINDLADMAQLKDYAAAAIRDWAVQNPNAAQGIEAVSNIFTAVIPIKGIGAVRGKYGLGGITAHPVKRSQMGAIALPKGKSAVSNNFADAAYAKYPSPYHSRNIRSNLEQRYGKENITSSTVPPSNGKNVKLADQRHPKTGVPFDGKGFPNFEKHVKYDTKLDIQELSGGGIPKAKPVFDAKPRWEVDRKLNKLTTREQV
ncbi:polymorphic toxin MafB class 2, partial [Neisseria meningitidis]|nr:polymorphic toxin MafB class 2 [Neisseria meningitidis]MBJ7852177.1 polymorphic toxin MafB class 2 [Neisseria meningitidis]